jgi:type I restriction enzyme S subunit
LEETAPALYKQWFVDFEFQSKNGEPYKSAGGEMVESKLGDIPKGWKSGCFDDVSTIFTGYSFDGAEYGFDDGISVLRGENVTEKKLRWDTHKKWNQSVSGLDNYFLKEFDVVIGMDGSKVGKNWAIISRYELPLLIAQRVACVRAINPNWQCFIYYSLLVNAFDKYVDQVQTGTSVPHISSNQILEFPLVIPESHQLEKYHAKVKPLLEHIMIISHQNTKLNAFGDLLLSKLATVE